MRTAAAVAFCLTGATTAQETHDLEITREFEAPVEAVWNAWSDGDAVRAWWGPRGFTVPVAQMDFRIGGTSLVCMRPPQGPDLCNSWTYSQIVPHERIAFDLDFVDVEGEPVDPAAIGLPPDIPDVVPHLVTFEATDTGGTRMSVLEKGYGSAKTVEMSRMGLEQVLDKMAAYLAE
ncbi:hypothetical protein VE25_20670 [Devosia geojensis]|uniref:Activator of Hsp90 ATPase homologue 1/2-like C-terminal domain-containing protein n=1 Tax=Devosia geojensis TaxID=443610 RepID=A0A0F5FDI8_9HYPH|nr:hypothetical protein VE25_20670 [Devosia geojensis]